MHRRARGDRSVFCGSCDRPLACLHLLAVTSLSGRARMQDHDAVSLRARVVTRLCVLCIPAWLARTFPLCENISIDFAVLEKAKGVVGIPAGDIGWNDVGSWNAVYELENQDAQGNTLRADALIEASTGNFVDADKKMVALLG